MAARKYSEAQRLAFMALIDRGGSVRAACAAVGVHPDAGYAWMKKAGLSTPRSTQRRYMPEQKAEFLSRLEEVRNVSALARELGINRVTATRGRVGRVPGCFGISGHERGRLRPRGPSDRCCVTLSFCIDENFPRDLKEPLARVHRHHRFRHVTDIGAAGMDDVDLFAYLAVVVHEVGDAAGGVREG